jgi:hypothetical protein
VSCDGLSMAFGVFGREIINTSSGIIVLTEIDLRYKSSIHKFSDYRFLCVTSEVIRSTCSQMYKSIISVQLLKPCYLYSCHLAIKAASGGYSLYPKEASYLVHKYQQ